MEKDEFFKKFEETTQRLEDMTSALDKLYRACAELGTMTISMKKAMINAYNVFHHIKK
jgi:hypothetical protein